VEEIESLRQFLDLERYLCHPSGDRPCGCWTALGDFYLPPDAEIEDGGGARPSVSWFQGESFRAPMLGSIVLDACRPFTKTDYPPPMGEVINHTPKELEFIKWRLQQSMEQISRISSTARSAVEALLQVITVVRAPKLTKGTQSFSNKPAIGRMGLANSHSDEWSVSKIADAIVHEAIHALIYKLELTNSLYVDDTMESEPVTAVSPWSGRTLRLHSFLHACFVWFGLWNFWGLASRDEPEALDLRGTAANGFLIGHPLSCIPDAALARVRPEVRNAIDEMFKQVTSNVN
jgi:HEXXH motif-containing protein